MANHTTELRNLIGKRPLNMCAAGVIIIDEKKRVLLQHRVDSETWGIPGGCVELGERLDDAAKREVFEETNLTVDELKLLNVYSGEEQHWIYPDGNEVYIINIIFITKTYSGIIKADGKESKEIKFFELDNLPEIIPTNIPILKDLIEKIDRLSI